MGSKWVVNPNMPITTHLLIIDPSFQRDIQVTWIVPLKAIRASKPCLDLRSFFSRKSAAHAGDDIHMIS